MQLPAQFTSSAALISALLLGLAHAADEDPLANGPVYSNDKFPPYPPLTNADGSNITVENLRGTRLYGWKGCEVDETKAIASAFDDMYKLANPLASQIDWADEISEDFWGKNEGRNRVPDDRRTQIQQIFKAQQQMYATGWHILPPYWTSLWIEVRCSGGDGAGDPDNICRDKKPNDGQCGRGGTPIGGNDNTLEAYTESTTNYPKLTYSRITFCNKFFNLPSLSEAMSTIPNKPASQKGKLEAWENRARVFQHEAAHLDYFMNAPGSSPLVDDLQFDWKDQGTVVRDWAYGPFFCKMLRNYGQGGEVAFYPQRNADSFAWFALGSYVRQVTGTYPRNPRPRSVPIDDPANSGGGDVRAAGSDPAQSQGQPPEDIVADSTEDSPAYAEGFSTPNCPDAGIKSNALSSDTKGNDSDPTPPAVGDKNACHGISGDYWVMSRDVAVENVQDFCGQTERNKTYNVGSVNELELSIKKLNDDTQGPNNSTDCVDRFQNVVIDGCDSDDPINNPDDYKFGSTLTTVDGWEYKMTPLSKQVNEVNCDVSYKFLYDGFEVRGKNWADAKLGANGEGLREQLSGCGALTEWKFERTPDDCCFQWYASGQLPIGTKACVGRAVQSAGGSNEGNCHGAGKRDETGHNSIDDWPGYGNDSRHVFKNEVLRRDTYRRVFRNGQNRRRVF